MKYTLCLAILCQCFGNTVFAEESLPLALLGGQGPAPYAAFLLPDGSIQELAGLPPAGLTYRVAINPSGEGIVGGTSGLNAYAALVSPNGVLQPINGLIAPGEIYSVAINSSGNGAIGGGHLLSNVPYAALISTNAVATPLPVPASGLVYSVAINNSGNGLVGGVGPASSAFAELFSANGAVTPLTGLPTTGGIFWVAVNDSNTGFIGGSNNLSVYAAFVDPNGNVAPVTGLPLGLLYSVALNSSGDALMGGTSSTLPYAALVAPNGAVTTLNDLPTTAGKIYNVVINNSGTGLIAGYSTSGPYGSLVAPNGTLTPLIGLPVGDGFLDGAALDPSGVGIVGGTISNTPFAALVAPNGVLTFLDGLPATGEINTIAITDLVPKSIGPFDSFANTQFALADALTQHCIIHQRMQDCSCNSDECYSVWLSLFGNYVREKSHHSIPTFSNTIGGALLGFDYFGLPDLVVGGAIAYAYNSVHYMQNLGRAAINQESLVLYATWERPCFYLNGALWTGIFQTTNNRKSFGFITSKSTPSGWNLSPHLELGTSFIVESCPEIVLEPFVAFDSVNNWQSHYRENGYSGFNLELNHLYASIFRSELGVRFYESLLCQWGQWFFEEKVSYINRTPLQNVREQTSFIGAFSSFDVKTLNCASKNIGCVQLHVECIPSCLNNLYTSIDYQGEFGSAFQSHLLTLTLGKDF